MRLPLRRRALGVFLAMPCLVFAALAGCVDRRQGSHIIIGVRTSNCQAPFYIADRQNRYVEQGLDASVRLVSSNTEIIEAMQRGDFQIGSVPVTTAIAAIARGSPLHVVATTGRGSDGLLVRREDGLVDLGDLRGKRVVTIRASILDVLLRHALQQAGIDPDRDVELVYMSKLGDMISALKTGQVDATSNTEPFMTDAERQGWGQILTYYTATWPDHPCCVVLARDDFAKRNPKALRAILSVHCDAVDWANAHIDETAQIIVDYLGAFDPDLVRESLDRSKMLIDYNLESSELERMASLMASQELIEPISAGALADLDPLHDVLRDRP